MILKYLKLKNLALAEEAEVEFCPSFNVITGETGAGKSVIMGALSLLLGERADKGAIRSGADKCEISAEFVPSDRACDDGRIKDFLCENEIDTDDNDGSIILRRVITHSSSRNFINGIPSPLSVLKKLGFYLVDVHAANANQSLLHASEQMRMADRFADLGERLASVRSKYGAYKEAENKFERLKETLPSPAEAEHLRRDVEAINAANPEVGEDERLKERHAIASDARTIVGAASAVAAALSGSENSVFDSVAQVRRVLRDVEKSDPAKGGEFASRIDEISSLVTSLSSDLERYAADIELDEQAFRELEERMAVLQTLKRKFGHTLEDVLNYQAEAEERLAVFDDSEKALSELESAVAKAKKEFLDETLLLTDERKKSAKILAKRLSEETIKLGFARASFDIVFSPVEPGPDGADAIEILFSANPGSPLLPLSKVASSGEVSRIMLAMKTVLAEADSISVLVFDEIDANIGGETASVVGEELFSLAKTKQVITISHLAQAARMAVRHFKVEKKTSDDSARSTIKLLGKEERIKELARMLGGGDAALAHARALAER